MNGDFSKVGVSYSPASAFSLIRFRNFQSFIFSVSSPSYNSEYPTMYSALDFAFPSISSFVCRTRRGIPSSGFGSRLTLCSLPPSSSRKAESCLKRDTHQQRSSLESMFCYDKPIPEEIIEEPERLSISEKEIGDNMRCTCCEAKGALLCATCSGTGLYVDSIMESQGIIVKVRCLGCGGSGNIMCKICGGRGHVGH